jgi:hypothetical protein
LEFIPSWHFPHHFTILTIHRCAGYLILGMDLQFSFVITHSNLRDHKELKTKNQKTGMDDKNISGTLKITY